MAKTTISPLSNTEVASFCSQMGMVLKSGISTIEGVSIMLEDSSNQEETALMTTIHETLMQTGSFYEALQATKAYPAYMLHMIQLGEQTGKLDEVMNSLSVYYEKEANLAQTIKNAVTYPFIMIVMMIIVILVLVTKVLPIFNQVFKQLGSEMSGISKVILDIGNFLNQYAAIFITCIVILVLFTIYIVKSKKGQAAFVSLIPAFSGTKALSERIAACRFANGMSLTLSSGLTPEECLNLTTQLVEQPWFKRKLEQCRDDIAEGADLCTTLLTHGVFSGVYARMASIGSKTGVLDDVMKKIADQYEEDIDIRISGIIATIEPTLVIILSVIVGIILLSVMLPLMSVMSAL